MRRCTRLRSSEVDRTFVLRSQSCRRAWWRGAAALAVWPTPLPDVVKVLVATAVFYALLVALRGIPTELTDALLERWREVRRGEG